MIIFALTAAMIAAIAWVHIGNHKHRKSMTPDQRRAWDAEVSRDAQIW